MKLSAEMNRAVELAKQFSGVLKRFPGGFWRGVDTDGFATSRSFGTSTVQALVSRGVMEYVEFKQNGRGGFPVAAKLKGGAA